MKGFIKALVIVPLAALLTLFAVVNRTVVDVTFDPLEWTGMGQKVSVPLFLVIFAAAAIGVIIGGTAVWFGQGRHRKAARYHAREAERHRAEAERHRAELDALRAAAPSDQQALAPPVSTLR